MYVDIFAVPIIYSKLNNKYIYFYLERKREGGIRLPIRRICIRHKWDDCTAEVSLNQVLVVEANYKVLIEI